MDGTHLINFRIDIIATTIVSLSIPLFQTSCCLQNSLPLLTMLFVSDSPILPLKMEVLIAKLHFFQILICVQCQIRSPLFGLKRRRRYLSAFLIFIRCLGGFILVLWPFVIPTWFCFSLYNIVLPFWLYRRHVAV